MTPILKLTLFSLFLTVSGFARDVIMLSNGDVLKGDIVQLDIKKGLMRVKFSEGNALTVRFSDIDSVKKEGLTAEGPMPAPLKLSSAGTADEAKEEVVQQKTTENSKTDRETLMEVDRRIASLESSSFESAKNLAGPSKLGLKVGANFASVSVGAGETTPVSSRTGFVFGIVNDSPVSEKFSIQSELAYSQYGYSQSGLTLSYDTIEAQLLGKYSLLERKSFARPAVLAGLAPAFRLSSRVSGSGVDVDASSISNTFSLAGVLGGSVLFGSRGRTEYGLDFRYIFGLTDVSKTTVSVKNSTFYFGSTFLF